MVERPILFQGAMVRALLDGSKTQTRRLVKPQPTGFVGGPGVKLADGSPAPLIPMDETVEPYGREIRCPYGQAGDHLWVREAWRVARKHDAVKPSDLRPRAMTVEYEAGGYACNGPWNAGQWTVSDNTAPRENPAWVGKLRPGMFMPRWASRITLEVTGVREERLQDISEADARAEGIETNAAWPGGFYRNYALPDDGDVRALPPRDSCRSLWEHINGTGSWDANPWVWVVGFRRLTC